MKHSFLDRLRCPRTQQVLLLQSPEGEADEIESGWLVSADGEHRYPIRNGIPRFVPESNYADNFGMQWNLFSRTQLDSFSGHPISAERFWKATDWRPEDMAGRWVLDAGCGAGRFAEVALEAGARVVALDYSVAVDACYDNLKHHPNLHAVQGDIYALPFAPESFEFVYSLGVLQHTPDVGSAFACLSPMLAPGGRLCVDYYEKSLKSAIRPKYWIRPLTKRMSKRTLLYTLQIAVPPLLSVSRFLGRIPVTGRYLKRMIPVANYHGIYPLSESQHQEWALLDTFDALAPEYDQPQTARTVRRWLTEASLDDIEVLKAGHLVGRGTKRSL